MSTDPACLLLLVRTLQDLTSEPPDVLTIAGKLLLVHQAPSLAPLEDLGEQSSFEKVITNPGLMKPQCASRYLRQLLGSIFFSQNNVKFILTHKILGKGKELKTN